MIQPAVIIISIRQKPLDFNNTFIMQRRHFQNLLEKNGLKKTKLRIALLKCLYQSKHAQSYTDIKTALAGVTDKSTLYRNLSTFKEVGIIHFIYDDSGVTKYAFGQQHGHNQNHAHFVCESCESVYCMDFEPSITARVPKGFKPNYIKTIIRGICANC